MAATTAPWFCNASHAFSMMRVSFCFLYSMFSECIRSSSCISWTFISLEVSLISLRPATKQSLPSSVASATCFILACDFFLTPVLLELVIRLLGGADISEEDSTWGWLGLAPVAAGIEVAEEACLYPPMPPPVRGAGTVCVVGNGQWSICGTCAVGTLAAAEDSTARGTGFILGATGEVDSRTEGCGGPCRRLCARCLNAG
jgi:hypothetical protein